jgi:hypothetical protein
VVLEEREQRVSDYLVRLVQILFALVVAQSLLLLREVILDPFASEHQVAALAIVDVYVMTVFSWIDWHVTVTSFPYNVSQYNTRRKAELTKLFVDLLIVTAYAFALLSIDQFKDQPAADIAKYLWVYPAVYALYLAAGIVRSRGARTTASNYLPIGVALALFVAVAVTYESFDSVMGLQLRSRNGNLAVLGVVLLLTLGYRLGRAFYRTEQLKARKRSGLRIGIDVDGVLADQIRGVLPRIEKRHGVTLTREQVVHWKLPIGDTDIAEEIVAAMTGDTDYVRSMRPHDGAVPAIRELFRENWIVIVTARPKAIEKTTIEWLQRNGVPYDELISTQEGKKSLY